MLIGIDVVTNRRDLDIDRGAGAAIHFKPFIKWTDPRPHCLIGDTRLVQRVGQQTREQKLRVDRNVEGHVYLSLLVGAATAQGRNPKGLRSGQLWSSVARS